MHRTSGRFHGRGTQGALFLDDEITLVEEDLDYVDRTADCALEWLPMLVRAGGPRQPFLRPTQPTPPEWCVYALGWVCEDGTHALAVEEAPDDAGTQVVRVFARNHLPWPFADELVPSAALMHSVPQCVLWHADIRTYPIAPGGLRPAVQLGYMRVISCGRSAPSAARVGHRYLLLPGFSDSVDTQPCVRVHDIGRRI